MHKPQNRPARAAAQGDELAPNARLVLEVLRGKKTWLVDRRHPDESLGMKVPAAEVGAAITELKGRGLITVKADRLNRGFAWVGLAKPTPKPKLAPAPPPPPPQPAPSRPVPGPDLRPEPPPAPPPDQRRSARARPDNRLDEVKTRQRLSELRKLAGALARAGLPTAQVNGEIADGGGSGLISLDRYKLFGRTYGWHPRTLRPIGITKHEVRAYLRRFRAPKKAAREAAKREAAKRQAAEAAARVKSAVGLDVRHETIFTVVGTDWQTTADLMTTARGLRAFVMANGKPLCGHGLRVAVLRALAKLGPLVETKDEKLGNGKIRRLVRRKKM